MSNKSEMLKAKALAISHYMDNNAVINAKQSIIDNISSKLNEAEQEEFLDLIEWIFLKGEQNESMNNAGAEI